MPNKEIPAEWTVLSMLEWGTNYLKEKSVNTPRLSLEWLLSHVLECKRLDLYLKFDRPLTGDELAALKPLLMRRGKHEPLQYITGSTNFFGLEIQVNSDVLIPRPETEQLVEIILEDNPLNVTPKKVLDIGTGSGCIALALKANRSTWQVYASDISEAALNTAQLNATNMNLEINFFKSDLLRPAFPSEIDALDIIVSNPPYIESNESNEIDAEVKNYEPALALFHDNVASVYEAIIRLAEKKLKQNGILYLEINQKHGELMKRIFDAKGWDFQLLNDYNGHPRMLKCTYIKST
jgi:release factor glutamine methyltransferase